MSALFLRMPAHAFLAGIFLLLTFGCVVAGGGYGYGDGVGAAYYEPVGYNYGWWGPGYQVGPYYRGGVYRGGNGGAHAYRAAPASRSMPSIASRARSGGGGRSGSSRER